MSETRRSRRNAASADPRSRAALVAALIGFFVVTLDAVVVNVALRQISTDLHTSMAGLQWIVDGYTLLFAACLLSAGAFADRIGARRAYVIGMGVFVAASLGCGVAPTVGILIAARVVQGAAAALMLPSSMALIGRRSPMPVSVPGPWACGRWVGRSPRSPGPCSGASSS